MENVLVYSLAVSIVVIAVSASFSCWHSAQLKRKLKFKQELETLKLMRELKLDCQEMESDIAKTSLVLYPPKGGTLIN